MKGLMPYYRVLERGGVPSGVPFEFTIKTDNLDGPFNQSANNQFQLGLISSGAYNFTVNWGDGSSDVISTWNDVKRRHTYASIGTYNVSISGEIRGWHAEGDRRKYINITQWGCVKFLDVSNFTFGVWQQCANLNVTATDSPDFSECTQQAGFFYLCTSLVGTAAFNTWDVSMLTNIGGFFRNATNFNSPIGNWDVSNVTNFDGVFAVMGFNQNISTWNVGNGTSFLEMFRQNGAFNQNISGWNMSSALSLRGMFWQANAFNQPIGSWNVSNVTNFSQMFFFKNGLTHSLDAWNVGNGQNFFQMFYGSNYNQPLGSWNMILATNCGDMFRSSAFNQNIGSWDIRNVTNFTQFMLGKTPTNFSAANLDAIYNGWSSRPVKPNIVIDFGTIKYTASGQAGRDILTTGPNNWTITDGGI